jgi:hypothetical protein
MRSGPSIMRVEARSERPLVPAETTRVPVVAAGNLSAVVDGLVNQAVLFLAKRQTLNIER